MLFAYGTDNLSYDTALRRWKRNFQTGQMSLEDAQVKEKNIEEIEEKNEE